ncbi:MAG: deoxyribodipyrimidine photo-lyase [Methylomicrobium sp.]
MTRYQEALHIFRRDLRLDDNTSLNEALRLSERVLACFIFDPSQIQPHRYRSEPALQFMLHSLDDLANQLRRHDGKLHIFYGKPEQVVKHLIDRHAIDAVFINRDYTPFSRQRDYRLATLCSERGVSLHSFADALLTEPEQAVKNDGTPYQVFTPFYNNARKIPVTWPESLSEGRFVNTIEDEPFDYMTLRKDFGIEFGGGRREAQAVLERLARLTDYQTQRDYPERDSTSRLSAHLKFGTISIREAYHAVQMQLSEEHPLLRQFYWRDFFTHIGFHYPEVFGHAFHRQYDHLPWQNDENLFAAWADGRTGFPIVDAGMRELNRTGYMHNRVRMITASFLTKDLHISWRWGERYFAQRLVDYDPCVNNGNWQWAASTGCDAQPYFRIFNPWLQQRKFDPDCAYIYRWIPELRSFSPDLIHRWENRFVACDYPKPIVDHKNESEKAKQMFAQLKSDVM